MWLILLYTPKQLRGIEIRGPFVGEKSTVTDKNAAWGSSRGFDQSLLSWEQSASAGTPIYKRRECLHATPFWYLGLGSSYWNVQPQKPGYTALDFALSFLRAECTPSNRLICYKKIMKDFRFRIFFRIVLLCTIIYC